MSGTKKSNRKFRRLKMESLEKRELMAGDVTASVSNGVLLIRGTDGADNVGVESLWGTTRVWSNGRVIHRAPTSSYTAINADMLNGRDRLSIVAQDHRSLNRIDVDMGRGSDEWVNINVGKVGTVNINADSSVGTQANLNASVIDKAFVRYGNDGADDALLVHGSSIGYLESNLGGGNDYFEVRGSSIQRAAVNMGSGKDRFDLWTSNSQIASGFVDGGEGNDRFRNMGGRPTGGVQIRKFEW